MIQAHSNRISEAVDFVEDISKKISESEGNENAATIFEPSIFWTSLRAFSQKIFLDVTKLSFALSAEENIPSSCLYQMLDSIQKDLQDVSSVFFSFPKQCGSTLRLLLRESLTQIVSDCGEFFKFLIKTPVTSQNFKKELKQLQAVILTSTERIEEHPTDNKSATVHVLSREEALINDAFEEIREELSAQTETHSNTPGFFWNNKQYEMAEKSVDVLKTTKSLSHKINSAVAANGKCSTENQISQLDDLVDNFQKLSPVVDDFVLSLYPPSDNNHIKENMLTLKNLMNQLLTQVEHSHYVTETDMQWVNFLRHAVVHNCSKLDKYSTNGSDSEEPLIILSDLSLNS